MRFSTIFNEKILLKKYFRTIERFKSCFSALFLIQMTTSGILICVSTYNMAYVCKMYNQRRGMDKREFRVFLNIFFGFNFFKFLFALNLGFLLFIDPSTQRACYHCQNLNCLTEFTQKPNSECNFYCRFAIWSLRHFPFDVPCQ